MPSKLLTLVFVLVATVTQLVQLVHSAPNGPYPGPNALSAGPNFDPHTQSPTQRDGDAAASGFASDTSALVMSGLLKLQLYDGARCTVPTPSWENDSLLSFTSTECYEFNGRAGYAEVLIHEEGLKYNAFRGYKTKDCSGGWTLIPIYPGGKCWSVGEYGSLRIVLE